MGKPAILFRFHKSFDVCAQNLDIIRKLNPGVPIHGLYGGFGGNKTVPKFLKERLDSLFAVPLDDPFYAWMHGDLCFRLWYKTVGHKFEFSHLFVIEWDWLYLKPLKKVYRKLQDGANYLTIADSYEGHLKHKWPWIRGHYRAQFMALVKMIRKEKPLDLKGMLFGICCGCVLCRPFLDKFIQRQIPSYCNDEVRLRLYSALFDIPVIDNGAMSCGLNKIDASGKIYNEKDIDRVLAKGGFALHAVRELIPGLLQKLSHANK